MLTNEHAADMMKMTKRTKRMSARKEIDMKKNTWYRFTFKRLEEAEHLQQKLYRIIIITKQFICTAYKTADGSLKFDSESDLSNFVGYHCYLDNLKTEYKQGILTSTEMERRLHQRYDDVLISVVMEDDLK